MGDDHQSAKPDLIAEQGYLFLGSRLKRLAERMQADVSRLTQGAGIAVYPGQFPLLAILSDGPGTVNTLSQALGLSQPVTTRNVNKLIEVGLVKAEPCVSDGRSKQLSLSEQGRQVMDRSKRTILPFSEAAVKQLVDGVSGSLLAQLSAMEAGLAQSSLAERARRIAASQLTPASDADLPGIVAMMNLAYRGSGSESHWTTEAAYISGERINETLLRADIRDHPTASLLTWRTHAGDAAKGSVWLQPLENGTWYLGSLTVDPRQQNRGLGQTLLYCAEQWIRERQGRRVQMTVMNVRDTLIDWYVRRGYRDTGERAPFPYDDNRFGTPLRDDLCFFVLEKDLTLP
jgi:DNA-binding MarR family transcriptional regulator/predicted N-acetyltransferase YhbS